MSLQKKRDFAKNFIQQKKTNNTINQTLIIKRSQIWISTYEQILTFFSNDQSDISNYTFRIQFHNEFGSDAGGLRREWYSLVFKDLFNPMYGLWRVSSNGISVQPSPYAKIIPDYLLQFKVAGQLIGNAFINNENIEVEFTRSFLKHILGKKLFIKDLEDIDPEESKSLMYILDECDDASELGLTFTYYREYMGQKELLELVENGKNIQVTNENKKDYVKAIAQLRMTTDIKESTESFLEGLFQVIPRESLLFFNELDFGQALAGTKFIDVKVLKQRTQYSGYQSSSQIIKWFWEIMENYDQEMLGKFLFFISGSFKPPYDEFTQSNIQIRELHKLNALPLSHTCSRALDLPNYSSKELLKEKLEFAILEGEGYGFG